MKETRRRKWWSDKSSVCEIDLLCSCFLKLHSQCLVDPKYCRAHRVTCWFSRLFIISIKGVINRCVQPLPLTLSHCPSYRYSPPPMPATYTTLPSNLRVFELSNDTIQTMLHAIRKIVGRFTTKFWTISDHLSYILQSGLVSFTGFTCLSSSHQRLTAKSAHQSVRIIVSYLDVIWLVLQNHCGV
jgi:hypothetical protein